MDIEHARCMHDAVRLLTGIRSPVKPEEIHSVTLRCASFIKQTHPFNPTGIEDAYRTMLFDGWHFLESQKTYGGQLYTYINVFNGTLHEPFFPTFFDVFEEGFHTEEEKSAVKRSRLDEVRGIGSGADLIRIGPPPQNIFLPLLCETCGLTYVEHTKTYAPHLWIPNWRVDGLPELREDVFNPISSTFSFDEIDAKDKETLTPCGELVNVLTQNQFAFEPFDHPVHSE